MKIRSGSSRSGRHGKLLALSAALAVVPLPVLAADDGFDTDSSSSATTASDKGHWYLGAATGYFKPDGSRDGGNTRSLGVQAGYQTASGRWSLEIGDQRDAGGPNGGNLEIVDINAVRYWGTDVRFLFEFGYSHVNFGVMNPSPGLDQSTAGEHIGVGLSKFLTDNLELRGDIKYMHTVNQHLSDGLGTLSLNYHFVEAKPTSAGSESALGASSEDTERLPPMDEYRESAVAPVAPAAPAAPAKAVAQPAPEEPEQAPAKAVAPVAAAAPAPAKAAGEPKSVHTLLNFGYDKVDVDAKYGKQLDDISGEIKSTNSRAVIEGHTDSKGSAAYNKVLSMDRAIMVKRELTKRGINGADLEAVGYGDEHPVAPNDTAEGRARNRRVEVKVYDKP